jgi:hypothetical protein
MSQIVSVSLWVSVTSNQPYWVLRGFKSGYGKVVLARGVLAPGLTAHSTPGAVELLRLAVEALDDSQG